MYSELDFDLWSSWIGKGAINCERILAVIVVEMVFLFSQMLNTEAITHLL